MPGYDMHIEAAEGGNSGGRGGAHVLQRRSTGAGTNEEKPECHVTRAGLFNCALIMFVVFCLRASLGLICSLLVVCVFAVCATLYLAGSYRHWPWV